MTDELCIDYLVNEVQEGIRYFKSMGSSPIAIARSFGANEIIITFEKVEEKK